MNKKRKFYLKSLLLIIIFSIISCKTYRVFLKNNDLTISGYIQQSDGMGRQAIDLINMLSSENIDINFIGKINSTKDLSPEVKSVLENYNYKIGRVFINEKQVSDERIFHKVIYKILSKINGIPRSDQVFLSYTMFESDKLYPSWVKELNKNYDAAIVPDQNLISIYQNSGVNIPLFTVPLSVNLKQALDAPLKTKANPIFTFANFSAIEDRKNTFKLVKAFHQAFGNNQKVRLLLNSRRIDSIYAQKIIDYIIDNGIMNIDYKIEEKNITQYNDLFNQIDCYVSLSKGEGFSVQPREAMARGIPVIVSNALAQRTIADSGVVRVVEAKTPKQAAYSHYLMGRNFDIELDDAVDALKDMYHNYQKYLDLAPKARKWAQQYTYDNIKPLFITLVKPKKVILSESNNITKDHLMTNSEILYKKYLKIAEHP